MRSVVNDTAPPLLAHLLVQVGWSAPPSAAGRRPDRRAARCATSERPATPSNVHSPTADVGGSACSRAFSAATTLASRDLPPSSVFIDWSSMIVTAGFCGGCADEVGQRRPHAVVADRQRCRQRREVGHVALRQGAALGAEPGLRPGSPAASGLRRKRANSLAALTCSWLQPVADEQHGRIVGQRRRARRQPRGELVLRVAACVRPLEELLLGGDHRVHAARRRGRSACSSASIAVDGLVSASLG